MLFPLGTTLAFFYLLLSHLLSSPHYRKVKEVCGGRRWERKSEVKDKKRVWKEKSMVREGTFYNCFIFFHTSLSIWSFLLNVMIVFPSCPLLLIFQERTDGEDITLNEKCQIERERPSCAKENEIIKVTRARTACFY